MTSDEDQKNLLIDLIHQGEAKGRIIANYGGEIIGFGQRIADVGFASAEVLTNVMPNRTDLDKMTQAWQYANKQEDDMLKAITPIASSSTTTSGYAVNYSMTPLANASIVGFVPPDKQNETRQAAIRLSRVIDNQTDKNIVYSLLGQFGLNASAVGHLGPLNLFQTAYEAFEKPVTMNMSSSTSLIPMRECINAVVTELMRRRPKQERAGSQGDKILSICRQCKGPGITDAAMQSMADRWEVLVNELSASKNRQFSRDQWRETLSRATLFLIELLQSLDRSKMR